jgi:hypothetical protein
MALEAGVHLHGRTAITLQDLVIPTALLLRTNVESKGINLVLAAGDDERFMDFELNSISADQDESVRDSWQTHASGRLRMDKPEKLSNMHETPKSIQRRCTIEHTLPEFYDFMWKREYGLGPMFQLIEHIYATTTRLAARSLSTQLRTRLATRCTRCTSTAAFS